MPDDSMAARLKPFRELIPQFESALQAFQSSGSKFRVLKTIHPSQELPQNATAPNPSENPSTLLILDSSFNPPSIAHRSLARSALNDSSQNRYGSPHRLLFLFSTMNADKAPSAASFPQRLAMMAVLARDLLDEILNDATTASNTTEPKPISVPVDIGVTTAPYYTDKTRAIESDGREWYPSKPTHIHLVGFDTLTRLFNPKYYPSFDPPLSALKPYFDDGGHRLRVTLRPGDEYGDVRNQKAFVVGLANGEMDPDGAKGEWGQQIDLIPPNPKTGVSSTNVRKAAKAGDWNEVKQSCTPGVAEWLKSEKLYDDDDTGAKMA